MWVRQKSPVEWYGQGEVFVKMLRCLVKLVGWAMVIDPYHEAGSMSFLRNGSVPVGPPRRTINCTGFAP